MHSESRRKRLNLDLSSEAYDLLQKLSDETGKNMADVLRTGLALYGIAVEESRRGRSLGIVADDEVVKEIILEEPRQGRSLGVVEDERVVKEIVVP